MSFSECMEWIKDVNRRINVLHVSEGLSTDLGGTAVAVCQLVNRLTQMGVEVSVLALRRAEAGEPAASLDSRVRAIAVTPFWSRRLGFSLELSTFLKTSFRTDLVHIHGLWRLHYVQVGRRAKKRGVPIVISPHGMLERCALARRQHAKRIASMLYQDTILASATCIHATSEGEYESLRRLGFGSPVAIIPWGVELPSAGMQERKVHCDVSPDPKISSGVSSAASWSCRGDQPPPSSLHPSPSGALPLRAAGAPAHHVTRRVARNPQSRRFRIGVRLPNKRFALCLSRIHPHKGLDLLLAAWARVQSTFHQWALVIAGHDEDGYRSRLIERVKRLGIAESVFFVGPVHGAEKEELFADAELFVLASRSENFGLVVAEALGRGLPVITTTGTPWSGISDWACGWWIDPEVEALSRTLAEALRKSPEELRIMGARGRAYVEKDFSVEACGRAMLEMYRWALGGEYRPPFIRLD